MSTCRLFFFSEQGETIRLMAAESFSTRVSEYLGKAHLELKDLWVLFDKDDDPERQKVAGNWTRRGQLPKDRQNWFLNGLGLMPWRDWFRDGTGDPPPVENIERVLRPLLSEVKRGRPPKTETNIVPLQKTANQDWLFWRVSREQLDELGPAEREEFEALFFARWDRLRRPSGKANHQ